MSQAWIDVTVGSNKERHVLSKGLTRVGGKGCDLLRPGTGGDELHFWSQPAKAVLVGTKTTPLVNGRAFEEVQLEAGDSIQWCGAVFVYGCDVKVLEELPADEPVPPEAPKAKRSAARPRAAAPAAVDPDRGRAWRRLQAGMLVELGLARKQDARRWQDAVKRGEFDADACARDVLKNAQVDEDDPRLLERAGRMERDLLMMPLQRGVSGASRRARMATRGGVAMLVSQGLALLVYSMILFAIFLLLRINNGFSLDGVFDGLVELVSPGGSDAVTPNGQ